MTETIKNIISVDQIPEQLPPTGDTVQDAAPHERQFTVEELRPVYEEWLEMHGIKPTSTPYINMTRQEYVLFGRPKDNDFVGTREKYDIPGDDQNDCQTVMIEIQSEDSNMSNDLTLVDVTDRDFGTRIGLRRIARDFQTPDTGPSGPVLPELPGVAAYRTIDIADAIAISAQGLQGFAVEVMSGKTEDPFSSLNGQVGVRAGGIAFGQKDAYVWTDSPFARSVELTIAFPSQYDSVCVVSGLRKEAGNGKPGMAQIVNPREELKIEGKNLIALQKVYQELYAQPDFAVTEEQRRTRNKIFNDYLKEQISTAASSNLASEEDEYDDYGYGGQQPQLRERELPH